MYVFLDTEFSSLHADGRLISIGLAAQDGRTFYRELLEGEDDAAWRRESCDPFVLEWVLPHLQGGESVVTSEQLYLDITTWVEGLGNDVVMLTDSPDHDFTLVGTIFSGPGRTWPPNLRRQPGRLAFDAESGQASADSVEDTSLTLSQPSAATSTPALGDPVTAQPDETSSAQELPLVTSTGAPPTANPLARPRCGTPNVAIAAGVLAMLLAAGGGGYWHFAGHTAKIEKVAKTPQPAPAATNGIAMPSQAATATPDTVASTVSTALAARGFPSIHASADHDLVVTLSGSVENQQEKARALAIAKSVGGVRDVKDQLLQHAGASPDTAPGPQEHTRNFNENISSLVGAGTSRGPLSAGELLALRQTGGADNPSLANMDAHNALIAAVQNSKTALTHEQIQQILGTYHAAHSPGEVAPQQPAAVTKPVSPLKRGTKSRYAAKRDDLAKEPSAPVGIRLKPTPMADEDDGSVPDELPKPVLAPSAPASDSSSDFERALDTCNTKGFVERVICREKARWTYCTVNGAWDTSKPGCHT